MPIEATPFDDAAQVPNWREHPTHGRLVDVAAIEVTKLISGYEVATVALDPTFNADNLPKMLVDSATREGMSGSVVLARRNSASCGSGARSNKRSLTGDHL